MPAAVVTLSALPLTENGKVDRAALPEPTVAAVEHVEPRDELETELAGLWSELLGVDRPGVLHSFFDLGGHSLLLAQLAGRIAERYGVDIPLQTLFEGPTIEKMATVIISSQLAQVSSEDASALLAEARDAEAG